MRDWWRAEGRKLTIATWPLLSIEEQVQDLHANPILVRLICVLRVPAIRGLVTISIRTGWD